MQIGRILVPVWVSLLAVLMLGPVRSSAARPGADRPRAVPSVHEATARLLHSDATTGAALPARPPVFLPPHVRLLPPDGQRTTVRVPALASAHPAASSQVRDLVGGAPAYRPYPSQPVYCLLHVYRE